MLLRALAGELRKIAYEYDISVKPHSDGTAKTGLGLLRTTAMIPKETIDPDQDGDLFDKS